MQPEVVIVPCAEYTRVQCLQALRQAFEPLDALGWVQPGMVIAVKANLVSHMKPEKAATTHPALLCALVELLQERGAQAVIGDSPGGLYTSAYVNSVYRATGMHEAEALGARLNQDFSQKSAEYPQGMVCRSFQYTAWLDGADAIIDFSKLKSHGMMGMSNAAKNLFGVIPGTMKPEYHFQYPNARDFARMIVDLDCYFKPRLCITDAIVGMEGNGPTAGTPRPIGAVLASFDPHRLDLVCASLIGLRRQDVPTLEAAFERGLIPASAAQVAVEGPLASLQVPDFAQVENRNSLLFRDLIGGRPGQWVGKFVQKAIGSVPAVHADECVGCGKCGEICPAHAIVLQQGRPVIDRKACIHCFCCQEFCPKGAMKVHRPPLARLLNR